MGRRRHPPEPLPVYLIGPEVQRYLLGSFSRPRSAAATNLNAAVVPPRVNVYLQTIITLGEVGGGGERITDGTGWLSGP